MMKKERRITQAYFDLACNQYAPLIQKLAFLIGINTIHIEELKSRAKEELLKCLICYHQSGSFMTFLYSRLIGVFRHLRDTENRAKRVQIMSLDSMFNMAGPNYDMDSNIMMQECLECLNREEREVVTDIYLNEKTMREISNSRGIVASTVCRIKARAINKMRQKSVVGLE